MAITSGDRAAANDFLLRHESIARRETRIGEGERSRSLALPVLRRCVVAHCGVEFVKEPRNLSS